MGERDLQDANARLLEDRRDIQVIQKWHTSTIKQRMVEWQNMYLQAHQACPYEGEVLFCDEKVELERDILRIVGPCKGLVRRLSWPYRRLVQVQSKRHVA